MVETIGPTISTVTSIRPSVSPSLGTPSFGPRSFSRIDFSGGSFKPELNSSIFNTPKVSIAPRIETGGIFQPKINPFKNTEILAKPPTALEKIKEPKIGLEGGKHLPDLNRSLFSQTRELRLSDIKTPSLDIANLEKVDLGDRVKGLGFREEKLVDPALDIQKFEAELNRKLAFQEIRIPQDKLVKAVEVGKVKVEQVQKIEPEAEKDQISLEQEEVEIVKIELPKNSTEPIKIIQKEPEVKPKINVGIEAQSIEATQLSPEVKKDVAQAVKTYQLLKEAGIEETQAREIVSAAIQTKNLGEDTKVYLETMLEEQQEQEREEENETVLKLVKQEIKKMLVEQQEKVLFFKKDEIASAERIKTVIAAWEESWKLANGEVKGPNVAYLLPKTPTYELKSEIAKDREIDGSWDVFLAYVSRSGKMESYKEAMIAIKHADEFSPPVKLEEVNVGEDVTDEDVMRVLREQPQFVYELIVAFSKSLSSTQQPKKVA